MRKKEINHHKTTVIQILKQHGELGFREIHREAQETKWKIASMQTLHKTLKTLQNEGIIEQNPITKKYRLTKNGEILAGKTALAETILASQILDTLSTDWKSEFCHILIQKENEQPTPYAMAIAHAIRQIFLQKEPLQNAIQTTIQTLNLKTESIEELWNTLFKNVKTITLVYTFEPRKKLAKEESYKP